ncbi:hypothetical protein F9C07_2286464 [Aspergillus flavus]|uniref:Uncharacterized protein n=4 Tax=Aspergillus subgen. Circumdati TaxID=2720871 RepID=A0A7U2R3S7_ASPFN|nr:hypothetical protein Ao3042_01453 [Aspergillus oryzae 3.042]KAB8248051.1 hypothetical protein BDV35DRAFT_176828 [Aspergillus flavus]GMF68408.1 unnamed protein product [Aspergillus oryzae]QRD94347.1 hypothetical protein F9C07_2286464 [Aspergillus flavus]GMF86360.1 unnamed protein product [Aspergillus oryzae]|eukprot:EIT72323.1 hypothetical protein Ao3042_01453 [Aspergillus oryzae 3.042]
MKWALFYLICLPVCWGVPLPEISLSSSDKDHDHKDLKKFRGMKSWNFFDGDHHSNTDILSPSRKDTDVDIDITKTGQHPLTLHQPSEDPDYTSNSNPNSHHTNNINNANLNNNNHNNDNSPTTHGTFLTTPNTPPTQIPPSTTKRYLRVLHDTQLPTNFLKNHMHEIVVVGLFLLIPVTLALVEIIERIGLGVDEGVELEDYLELERGRGMIRRGRRRVFRKKRGKKKKKPTSILEMDVEDQVFLR